MQQWLSCVCLVRYSWDCKEGSHPKTTNPFFLLLVVLFIQVLLEFKLFKMPVLIPRNERAVLSHYIGKKTSVKMVPPKICILIVVWAVIWGPHHVDSAVQEDEWWVMSEISLFVLSLAGLYCCRWCLPHKNQTCIFSDKIDLKLECIKHFCDYCFV